MEARVRGPTPLRGEGAQTDQISFIICFQAGEYIQGRHALRNIWNDMAIKDRLGK